MKIGDKNYLDQTSQIVKELIHYITELPTLSETTKDE